MFPKLNYMSRKLRIEEAVNQKWSREVESLLKKKKGKISVKRYQQLTIDIQKMKECIQEENFWRCFEHYWGKFTQDTKYKNSREDLKKFTEDFDQKIKDQAVIEEMKKKLPSLKRKKVSSSKAPQKQLESIYQETSHTE